MLSTCVMWGEGAEEVARIALCVRDNYTTIAGSCLRITLMLVIGSSCW